LWPRRRSRFPPDLEAWALEKVAAKSTPSVEAFVAETLRQRHALERLRESLDAAEQDADREGWLEAADVFAEVKAQINGV
jgi:hypothetical protein